MGLSWSMHRCHLTGVNSVPRKVSSIPLGQATRETFPLNAKMFPFNIFSRTQLEVKLANERSMYGGLYSEIWTA